MLPEVCPIVLSWVLLIVYVPLLTAVPADGVPAPVPLNELNESLVFRYILSTLLESLITKVFADEFRVIALFTDDIVFALIFQPVVVLPIYPDSAVIAPVNVPFPFTPNVVPFQVTLPPPKEK